MVGTTIPYQIVILTQQHSIRGEIFLRDQRLSDFLNDRREKNVLLRNASVARLESPGEVLENTVVSIIPKSGIVLAYELPQKSPFPPRFIKYPKERYPVYLILDGMEVRGELHMHGSLDLLLILADSGGDSFLPFTQATVAIQANPNYQVLSEAVVVSTQHIRLIGELEPKKPTEPK